MKPHREKITGRSFNISSALIFLHLCIQIDNVQHGLLFFNKAQICSLRLESDVKHSSYSCKHFCADLDASLWSTLGRGNDVLAWNTLALGRMYDLINLQKSSSITSHKTVPKHWWSFDASFPHMQPQFITKPTFNSALVWNMIPVF